MKNIINWKTHVRIISKKALNLLNSNLPNKPLKSIDALDANMENEEYRILIEQESELVTFIITDFLDRKV